MVRGHLAALKKASSQSLWRSGFSGVYFSKNYKLNLKSSKARQKETDVRFLRMRWSCGRRFCIRMRGQLMWPNERFKSARSLGIRRPNWPARAPWSILLVLPAPLRWSFADRPSSLAVRLFGVHFTSPSVLILRRFGVVRASNWQRASRSAHYRIFI